MTTSFNLRLPPDLKAAVTEQAKRLGVSVNQYIVSMLAQGAGAQAEAEAYFRTRAARAKPGRARDVLSRAGDVSRPLRDGDQVD